MAVVPGYREIDLGVIEALCRAHPDESGFKERLRVNRGALYLAHWAQHFEWQYAARIFSPGARVLDWGCGTGHSDVFLALVGFTVVGYDPDPLGIQIASYLRSLQEEPFLSRMSFHLEAPREYYEWAWASHVFEHIPSDEWSDAFRQIKTAGACRVLVSVPLGAAYFDPDHKNFWYDSSAFAADLERAGVELGAPAEVDRENQVIRAVVKLR
ncbi:MAG: methyltransferase domain-containing protein [Bdellovibrionales bacterium]|nr:methyltransferase domain-containing protein [Bdellovibrionales bacterium]